MSDYMIAAEMFQESIEGKAAVCVLSDEDGYFVPYRDGRDTIKVRVFTEGECLDLSLMDFLSDFPQSAEEYTEEGVTEWAPERRASVVYFISDGEAVKIGISKNPTKRLAQLQTGHPRRLSILATLPGGADEEMQLHGRFREHRLHGEWFGDCPEIRSYIACNDNKRIAARAAA